MKYLIGVLALVLAGGLWVRLAPSDPERWHVDPQTAQFKKIAGYRDTQTYGADADTVLGALNTAIMASPRTKLLAGSIPQRHLTYITRSRLWGFPDYTTVMVSESDEEATLTVYGRLRFGIGDAGTNRQRIVNWLQAIEAFKK